MKRTPLLATLVALGTLLLSGCTATVALKPAQDATNVGCASVVVHLPNTVADEPIRNTDAQGTGAWGDPETILLRCGVEPPAPTAALPCVYVEGVYWLRDDQDAPNYVLTTYGREPATEVIVNRDAVSIGNVLFDLTDAISYTTETGACTSIEDSLGELPSTSAPTFSPGPRPTPTVSN